MKNVIKLAVMMVALSVAGSAYAAQASGAKQTPPAKPAPAAPAKMEEPKSPCKAGEALKDAKKPFDAKTNPCVKKK